MFITVSLLVTGLEYSRVAVFGADEVLSSPVVVGRGILSVMDVAGVAVVVGKAVVFGGAMVLGGADVVGDSVVVGGQW